MNDYEKLRRDLMLRGWLYVTGIQTTTLDLAHFRKGDKSLCVVWNVAQHSLELYKPEPYQGLQEIEDGQN